MGDCWDCSTAGHGGFLLVARERYEYLGKPALRLAVPDPPIYVYEFEEDCAWAALLVADPRAMRDYYDKSAWLWSDWPTLTSWIEYVAERYAQHKAYQERATA